MLTLGTGVGCGIIINGKILHGGKGATGYAPEFGHAVIEVINERCLKMFLIFILLCYLGVCVLCVGKFFSSSPSVIGYFKPGSTEAYN